MRLHMNRTAMFLAAVAMLLVVGVTAAAENAVVRVLEDGAPAEGVVVEILVSAGAIADVTDGNGEVSQSISGTLFRVKVNGELVDGLHDATEGAVVVNLN